MNTPETMKGGVNKAKAIAIALLFSMGVVKAQAEEIIDSSSLGSEEITSMAEGSETKKIPTIDLSILGDDIRTESDIPKPEFNTCDEQKSLSSASNCYKGENTLQSELVNKIYEDGLDKQSSCSTDLGWIANDCYYKNGKWRHNPVLFQTTLGEVDFHIGKDPGLGSVGEINGKGVKPGKKIAMRFSKSFK